jgi:hypothetical protein
MSEASTSHCLECNQPIYACSCDDPREDNLPSKLRAFCSENVIPIERYRARKPAARRGDVSAPDDAA